MPKFTVQVTITNKREKELTIYARDEEEAGEKAEDLVLGWDGVADVEVVSVEEE